MQTNAQIKNEHETPLVWVLEASYFSCGMRQCVSVMIKGNRLATTCMEVAS